MRYVKEESKLSQLTTNQSRDKQPHQESKPMRVYAIKSLRDVIAKRGLIYMQDKLKFNREPAR